MGNPGAEDILYRWIGDKVAGKPCRLDHAFLEVDESGSVPSVTRVDLYGYALDTGELLKESFIP